MRRTAGSDEELEVTFNFRFSAIVPQKFLLWRGSRLFQLKLTVKNCKITARLERVALKIPQTVRKFPLCRDIAAVAVDAAFDKLMWKGQAKQV